MKISKILKIFIISYLLIFYSLNAFAKEDRYIYSRVKRSAKEGDIDFAFMGCQDIIDNYPDSKYRERCLFSNGTYYFTLPNLDEAKRFFVQFLNDYPESDGKIFALAYLHKISMLNADGNSVEEFRNQIVNQKQISLVFREKEKYKYKSVFNQLYTVNLYIDKIEFYVQGEILTKISY